jgi:hydroxysqualene synthase
MTTDAAFAHCEGLVRAHYENFPVGLFVPKDKRRYVHALYAFARAADDFADEPRYEGERLDRLSEWEARLHAAYDGQADDPVFIALAETVRQLGIPKQLLLDLLSAFRQDVVKTRYETWDEVLDYCRRSADPVGRLVLLTFGYRDAALEAQSDAICTALQLANHWQDLGIDTARGRLYVPRDLMAAHNAAEDDVLAGHLTPAVKTLLQDLVTRARQLFAKGRPLCDAVGRDLRFELRLTWLGGSRILDGIEAVDFDVFNRRPQHGFLDKAGLAYRAWRWR